MSNKRNDTLTNAAFFAVLLFCLLGVGAGAYLLLFPGTTSTPGTQPKDTPGPTTQVTEIIHPVTVPETSETAEILPAAPVDTEAADPEPVEAEPAAPADPVLPEIPEAKPVSAPPAEPVAEPTPKETPSAPAAAMLKPVDGDIIAAFSMDTLVYNATLEDWRTHDGVDISAEAGSGVLAAASGTVADIREDSLLGTTVVLQHSNGYRTTYAGLTPELAVKFGQRVESGQLIGAVGVSAVSEAAAGPHLHFSVSQNGLPVDPAEFLAS